MTWKVIHSSAIGNSHLRKKKPCQDYVSYGKSVDEHLLIGVVADGASSAKHSDKGAEIAVQCTIQYLQNRLKVSQFQNSIKDLDTANIFFIELLKIVQKKLENQANNNSYSVKDFACTLLVFIASPDWLAAMQVGDGLIVIRQNNRDTYQLLFKPDKGEFTNYTTFVTSSNAQTQMQVLFDKINLDFICVTTDWCENIAVIQGQNWKPFTDFFKPLEDLVLANKSKIGKNKIDDFLNSELINKETEDDKTLLLCVWDNSQLQCQPEATEENLGFVDVPNISPSEKIKKHRKATKPHRNNKLINKPFLISVAINLVALLVILFLTYKLKQPVATSYFVKDIDGRPTPIALEKKPLTINLWVLTSLESLDKKQEIITVTKESTFPFYQVDMPSPKLLKQTPSGYLPIGIYHYLDGKKLDQFYPEIPHRWVLIKAKIYR